MLTATMTAPLPRRPTARPGSGTSALQSWLPAGFFSNRGTWIFAAVVAAHAGALTALPNSPSHVRTADPVIVTMLQAPATAHRAAPVASPAAAQTSPRALPPAAERSLNAAASESSSGRTTPDLSAPASMTSTRSAMTSPTAMPAADNGGAPAAATRIATTAATTTASAAAPAATPVTPPRFDAAYLDNPAPAYPATARRFGEQGRVVLRVHVSADGLPRDIETATSSGSQRLDSAARAAVERWRFLPARQGEQAVAAWVLVPLTFTMTSTMTSTKGNS